jgi:hypothetical protein
LGRWDGTLLFVTHDRAFLRRLATRILEIDRGRVFDWSCDYDTFLQRQEEALAAEEKQNALFDKRLAEEEVWIRTGIKARRTRNEGRVRALEAMRRERGDRRDRVGKVNLLIQEAERSGTLVASLPESELARIIDEYGEDSDFVRVRVRGEFPRSGVNQFIPSALIDEAMAELSVQPKRLTGPLRVKAPDAPAAASVMPPSVSPSLGPALMSIVGAVALATPLNMTERVSAAVTANLKRDLSFTFNSLVTQCGWAPRTRRLLGAGPSSTGVVNAS